MPRDMKIIGLCGLPGTRKGTGLKILRILLPQDKTCEISTSRILHKILQDRGVENSRDRKAKQAVFSELKAKEGDHWLLLQIIETLDRSNKSYGIVDALCMPWDVGWLIGLPSWLLLYYEAPFEVCLARRRQAALSGKDDAKPDEANITEAEFRQMLQHETAIHVPSFRSIPGVDVIDGNSPIVDFGRQHVSVLLRKKLINQWELPEKATNLLNFYGEFDRKINART